jgi:hypothetical protein
MIANTPSHNLSSVGEVGFITGNVLASVTVYRKFSSVPLFTPISKKLFALSVVTETVD